MAFVIAFLAPVAVMVIIGGIYSFAKYCKATGRKPQATFK